MKRLLLELGGKGAGLVLADANIDVAVGAIGSVWTFHSGQICTAPTRAIVHSSRYDELVSRLGAYAPQPEGRRPDVDGHDRRAGDLGCPARAASRRTSRSGADEGARARRRRPPPGRPRHRLLRRSRPCSPAASRG